MKLYIVKYGDIFEYEHFSDTLSLPIINNFIKSIDEVNYPLANSNDIDLIRSSGGTIIYFNRGIESSVCIIDLDFKYHDGEKYQSFDSEMRNRFGSIRLKIKRDLSIDNLLDAKV